MLNCGIFWPAPPLTNWLLIYSIKLTQPPLLHMLFHDPLSPPMRKCGCPLSAMHATFPTCSRENRFLDFSRSSQYFQMTCQLYDLSPFFVTSSVANDAETHTHCPSSPPTGWAVTSNRFGFNHLETKLSFLYTLETTTSIRTCPFSSYRQWYPIR